MMGLYKHIIVLTLLAITVSGMLARPRYMECINSNECAVSTCCMLGMGKFTIPRCMEHGELGAVCRPDGDASNVTLSYPDGQVVDVSNVYVLACPCSEGLYCSRHTGTCQDPFEELKHNELDNIV